MTGSSMTLETAGHDHFKGNAYIKITGVKMGASKDRTRDHSYPIDLKRILIHNPHQIWTSY